MNHESPSTADGSPSAPSWFERPENIQRIITALVVACVLLVVADLFYENPHPHFGKVETFFGFQAWFGFIAFVVVVFLGTAIRPLIKKPETYYDPEPENDSPRLDRPDDSAGDKA
ncbi:hypothetical protein LOC71_07795 [Rhodopirellula sp. JC740]|uniref:Uncharacterized protein n=1 Tax=Rhodopirellula halodulae TaxID=2894198 RepID=A0ABS8NGV1_9BACT|nr:hypothetical protein [Rhodopirellula sp. JC740]MCC9642172.1 hypothetical protein [Rhodopirellula sp. JC740]